MTMSLSAGSGPLASAGTPEQRVTDFLPKHRRTFFGAVVSTSTNPHGRPESEHAPVLVTLVGQLDTLTAPLLRDCFTRIDGAVEVDCSGLDSVDGQGLAVFVAARARSDPDGKFVLVEPAPCLLQLLRITGLDAKFEIRCDAALVR